jgi:transcriptional regulator with XRE-family HTH domain
MVTIEVGPSVARRRIAVAAIRHRLHLSQRQFASCFGFPVATLRHWERGNRKPSGAATVLLQVIWMHPAPVLTAVRRGRDVQPWLFAKVLRTLSGRRSPNWVLPLR